MPKRNQLEMLVPDNTGAPYVQAGTAGTWGSWVQATPALPSDFALCAAHVAEEFFIINALGWTPGHYHYQVGKGAAGAETPVAQSSAVLAFNLWDTATVVLLSGRTLWFEPQLIPAATRLAIRAWGTSASALRLRTRLVGYKASDYEETSPLHRPARRYMRGLEAPAQGTLCWPTTGTTTVPSGSSWTFGPWQQFIASAPNDVLVTGVVCVNNFASPEGMAEIGVGPAPNEVPGGYVALNTWTLGPTSESHLPRPMFIKRGERVTVRTKSSGAARNFEIVLMGEEVK
jgi:hypothetical protein